MINIEIRESKKVNSDFSLFLTFEYDYEIVNAIREFSDRSWDNNNKVWELPVKVLGELVNKLPNQEFDIVGKYVSFAPKKAEIPADFEFKTTPFEHQIDGFNYGLSHNKWLLGDEQGLGKTKQVVDIAVAKKLQNGYQHCLIVCGVNGLKWNWVAEVATHSNETAYILGQKVSKNKIKIGSTQDKINDLAKIDELPYFLITNVESLRDETLCSTLASLCANKKIGLVAADEVHKMKNPSSQQGKGFLKLNSECKIAMTGTPLMNTPLDLYIILKWLGYEKHPFYAFKNHYCDMGGFGGYQIIGYKHLEELQERLNDIMLRRLKADVLDLPEKTRVNEYVDLTPKQAQIYKEVAMDIQMNIDKIASNPNPLASLIRMRQATGFTGILSSTIAESAKLDRMEELVQDAVDNNKKVVVFSNWTQMTDVIYDRLKKYGCRVITGETKDEDRQGYVYDFQNDSKVKVIIGTIGAMGTGLTLTAGTVEIFLDEPWTMASKEQAEDRCHRIGQNNNITVYTLMAKNTIDERIHEIVEKKGAMSNALVDGKVIGDSRELLNYLLS